MKDWNQTVYKCFEKPPIGNYIVGKSYPWSPGIDCVAIIDEDEKHTCFSEIEAMWYFKPEEIAHAPTMAIMIGIQASGKSSFCKDILKKYLRINLDMLKTRHKEEIALRDTLSNKVDIVIDNTNPTKADREKYISYAKANGYKVAGYFMQSILKDCIDRNENRAEKEIIPVNAISHTSNILELPSYEEGFDELNFVSMANNSWKIDKWRDSK